MWLLVLGLSLGLLDRDFAHGLEGTDISGPFDRFNCQILNLFEGSTKLS
ncbi:hypothetical protein [Trichocoleus sp. FACHB-591]|nr:hypothetical protein [Trichocoleus sp. FACHB-591]